MLKIKPLLQENVSEIWWLFDIYPFQIIEKINTLLHIIETLDMSLEFVPDLWGRLQDFQQNAHTHKFI